MLSTFIYPPLGSRPIAEITAPELLAALRVIEAHGTHETAHRTKQRVGQVFRYAIATGRAERDISVYLRGALAPVLTKNHAAIIDPISIGHLLRAIRPVPVRIRQTIQELLSEIRKPRRFRSSSLRKIGS